MSRSSSPFTRFSLILAIGSALLLSMAVPATEAAADASAEDASILWQMGLGRTAATSHAERDAPRAGETPAVSAAPPAAVAAGTAGAPDASHILWHAGLGR